MSKASPHRHLTALASWAMARIAELDRQERFEESFAITEEFREWILCHDLHPQLLDPLLMPRGRGLSALDMAE
ncbi:hypothetical protein FQK07_13155 [Synechococcus sp. BSF8S]|uniref:hypothetical protein n=1 Tax=Synechococcales TaxID=1890424 RepID=UPI00162A2DCB|nr:MULTISPECIES: hypothetical protein [unclassified Synechococcus]MBC1262193.1 hypothetical protein [Synechococcus sp. BSF8S]MBC1265142.1 hypothetical protein [Synechococcus sp. BSA11S]